MSRPIKFRGKRVDNGEWIYGDLVGFSTNSPSIVVNYGALDISIYDVIPESVGQYTGLQSKSGKEIYEGDIGWDDQNECYGVVEFSDGNFSYVWENICTDLYEVANSIDFIGNIHDNPSLLEV